MNITRKLRPFFTNLAASLANPILVRELRQAVRNRVILYGLQFYLLALLLAFFYTVFTHTVMSSSDMELGSKLFPILLNLTFYTTLASVLVYGAGRLVFERVNDDLMFYSTISPAGFVLGKMTCGFAISLMFYSVSFPFFTLIYLLRGVEITTLLLATGYSFCAVQLFLLMALVFFAGVDSWISATVRLVAFLVCGGGLFFFTAMIFYIMILGEQYQQALWGLFMLSASQFLLLPVLLFFLASCQFAPVEANRIWAFRIAATVVLLLSFVISLVASLFNFYSPGAPYFIIWIILVFYPFIFFCFLAMHERERYGFRVRRNIPRSFLGRLVAFPFYTGDYNALAWLSCWFLLLMITVPIYEMVQPTSHFDIAGTSPAFAALLLTYGYVSFTLYLWSKFLYRWVPKAWIGMITFALLLFAIVGNYAAVYFTDTVDIFVQTQILSVFFLIVPNYLPFLTPPRGSEWSVQLYFSLGVFALFFAVNLRETVRMFREFKRVEDSNTEPPS